MQKISIDEAEDGMVLARSILTEQGTTLCREETVLTTGLIETLRKRGITRLKVKGHPVERPDELSTGERIAEIMDRFSMVEDDSTTIRIRDAIIKQLRLEEEESDDDQECRS